MDSANQVVIGRRGRFWSMISHPTRLYCVCFNFYYELLCIRFNERKEYLKFFGILEEVKEGVLIIA